MFYVGGFAFEDEAMANQAKKEEEGVRFIKEKTTLSDPEVVLKLYRTLLEQKLFVTPVGWCFLMELQNILKAAPEIPNDRIPPIEAGSPKMAPKAESSKQETQKKTKKEMKKEKTLNFYKRGFVVSLFCAVVFGLSVLGMFVIAEVSDNNITILNYKNELINRYEQWEKELDEKEKHLKDWEKDLEERENAFENQ